MAAISEIPYINYLNGRIRQTERSMAKLQEKIDLLSNALQMVVHKVVQIAKMPPMFDQKKCNQKFYKIVVLKQKAVDFHDGIFEACESLDDLREKRDGLRAILAAALVAEIRFEPQFI